MAFPTVSYSSTVAPGYAGMIATTEPHWIISGVVLSSSGDIPFGAAVVFDVEVDVVKLPTAGGKFAGIAVADRTLPFSNGEVYKPYDQIALMKNGSIWVNALVAVAQGDPVYMTPTGGLTNVASGNTLINDAEWATVTAGAGVARLRLGISKV